MTKRSESIDRELMSLKQTLNHQLLSEFDGDKLHMKIREAIRRKDSRSSGGLETTVPQTETHPNRHRKSRWRRLGPFVAAATAVCLVVAVVALNASKLRGVSDSRGGSPTVTEEAGVFSAGFQPMPVSDAKQFEHVDSITVLLGNNWGFHTPRSVDGATIQLTVNQQQMFYHIMQDDQRKSVLSSVDQTTALPLHIWFGATNGNDQFMYEGYYSTSGAIAMGNQVYAPNVALAQFMNQYVISQLMQQYKKAGMVLPTSVSQASLGFVHHLENPSAAYKYCVPDMVFAGDTSLRQLQSEARTRRFTDFQIRSIIYGPGKADATVVLEDPNRFWAQRLTLNLVRVENAWLVIQAATGTTGLSGPRKATSGSQGTERQSNVMPGSPYGGKTLDTSFGRYHTLIIGPSVGTITPTGNTPYGKKGQYTVLTYHELNSPAFQNAQIIVYERTPLTGDSTIEDASRALKADPSFQKAVSAAKTYHAVLVVTSGGDNLLTRDLLVQTLGLQPTTGDDKRPATTITVWFEGGGKALFSGITAEEGNGIQVTSLDPDVLDLSISQAALIRDTWGAVMN